MTSEPSFVQSVVFDFVQPLNESSAEGHVDPSGQQESPAHMVTLEPGHRTLSPTLHLPPGVGGPGCCDVVVVVVVMLNGTADCGQ